MTCPVIIEIDEIKAVMEALVSSVGFGNLEAVAILARRPEKEVAQVMRAITFMGKRFYAQHDKAYRNPDYFENGEKFYAD